MNQVLSMTGIQQLTLVEKTPDAVQLRKDFFQGDDVDFKDTKELKSTMVRSTMPGVSSMVSNKYEDEEWVEYTEIVCCCIKVQRKVRKVNLGDKGKSDLEQRLIKN